MRKGDGLVGSDNPAYKHGHATRVAGYTKEYNSWCNMRRRCYDSSNNRFKTYGALGVGVCDRWNPKTGGSFEKFIEDMGFCKEGETLDRIDVQKGYCPENCRWAGVYEQANNKRNNKLFQSPQGEIWSLRRWCELKGLNYKSVWYYIFKKGKNVEYFLGDGFKRVDRKEESL